MRVRARSCIGEPSFDPAPHRLHENALSPSWSSATPSVTSEYDADSIMPAATAFETPNKDSEGLAKNKSGNAPKPVVRAASHP